MGMSKIDRIQDVYSRRMYAAIDVVALDLLRVELRSMGVYERLELADIIRGHRRAWPEVEASC